jgi:hypothetical protein
LRRDNPEFHLWSISKDGMTVSGNIVGLCMHGTFTKVGDAMSRIDEYLRLMDDKKKKNDNG